jgi:hypothetical protein
VCCTKKIVATLLAGTLHELLDMVLLLSSMWNESRRRNDSNRSGASTFFGSAPLVRFLRRIEKIGKTSEADGDEEGESDSNEDETVFVLTHPSGVNAM